MADDSWGVAPEAKYPFLNRKLLPTDYIRSVDVVSCNIKTEMKDKRWENNILSYTNLTVIANLMFVDEKLKQHLHADIVAECVTYHSGCQLCWWLNQIAFTRYVSIEIAKAALENLRSYAEGGNIAFSTYDIMLQAA